jgi:hypothetical protein
LDGRTEYFEVSDVSARSLVADSTVALILHRHLDRATGELAPTTPSLGVARGLCPDEPFYDQPAAAFCTGVLVDWDLVLTAGHCVRLLGLRDFAVVFGYHYASPGELALTPRDIAEPVQIVSEAMDQDAADAQRLDYAWLRLVETGASAAPARRHLHRAAASGGERPCSSDGVRAWPSGETRCGRHGA